MSASRLRRFVVVVAAAATALAFTAAVPASAAPPETKLAKYLVNKVTVDNAYRHLRALQAIADANGGTRAANTPGYDASVEYAAGQLRQAGFQVTTPSFTYQEEEYDAERLTVAGVDYALLLMEFSPHTPVGGITGPLAAARDDADSGCTADDFAGDFAGKVALVRRGGCTFAIKGINAAAAGAIAMVVMNNSPAAPIHGTLGSPADARIPSGMVSQADGAVLLGLVGQAAEVELRSHLVDRVSRNVIAQTRTGRTDNVVVVGAHLDSVPAGPGINDNGTGTAALLETARQLGGSPKVDNAVRFALWGAEELGLLGSEAYVAGLSAEERLDIALYLNFDMIGSPNYGHFVYDGDNSDGVGAGPGPAGSAQIEQLFVDYLGSIGVQTEGSDFTGRSDYGPFIAVDIPAGGLFTGAEGIKTAAQAAKWGGTAGIAYDPCYHAACDTIANPNRQAFERNADAVAWAVGMYGTSTEDVNGVQSRSERAALRAGTPRSADAQTHHTHAVAA